MADTNGLDAGSGRRFSLIRTLGEGSFGLVYLAEMEGAGGFRRRVALKMLNDTWDPASDAGRRLRDEARLLGRLEHRHIVRVDDLVQVNGRWALVMEYVSGADMERVFVWAEEEKTSIPPRAVAELGQAVASALVAAWEAPGYDNAPLNVVHRDIKPSNVRLSENGDVKVLDFGVALAAFAGREARTERVRYGSLGYMAPERILGEPDEASGDVYALGVMLWELYTTRLYGRAELGPDQQAAQVATAIDSLTEVIGAGPVVDLVARSLAYAAETRPTAREMEEALRTHARELPGQDLIAFARATIPGLSAAPQSDAVKGTILEESGTRSSSDPTHGGMAGRISSATLVVDPFDIAPPGRTAEAPPAEGRGGLWIGLSVGALLVLGLGAYYAFGLLQPATPTAGVPTTEPVAAAAPDLPEATGATPEDQAVVVADAAVEPAAGAPAASPSAVSSSAETPATPVAARTPARPTQRNAPPAAPVSGAAATVPPPEAAPAAPNAPRLRAAKFTLEGAEGIRVLCGDVAGSGTTSTLLREFPAGECVVTVGTSTARVRLDAPRGVACTVEGDSLTCR